MSRAHSNDKCPKAQRMGLRLSGESHSQRRRPEGASDEEELTYAKSGLFLSGSRMSILLYWRFGTIQRTCNNRRRPIFQQRLFRLQNQLGGRRKFCSSNLLSPVRIPLLRSTGCSRTQQRPETDQHGLLLGVCYSGSEAQTRAILPTLALPSCRCRLRSLPGGCDRDHSLGQPHKCSV